VSYRFRSNSLQVPNQNLRWRALHGSGRPRATQCRQSQRKQGNFQAPQSQADPRLAYWGSLRSGAKCQSSSAQPRQLQSRQAHRSNQNSSCVPHGRQVQSDLTLEQLDNIKIDDSFGSLARFTEAKSFSKLIEEHNNLESHFHFNLFEPFVIGRDLNAQDDIVYITFSTIWHLLNFLRNIALRAETAIPAQWEIGKMGFF
jgi:hypothetical protein